MGLVRIDHFGPTNYLNFDRGLSSSDLLDQVDLSLSKDWAQTWVQILRFLQNRRGLEDLRIFDQIDWRPRYRTFRYWVQTWGNREVKGWSVVARESLHLWSGGSRSVLPRMEESLLMS